MNTFKGLIKALPAIFIATNSVNVINASPLPCQYYSHSPGFRTADFTIQGLSENNKITTGYSELIRNRYSTDKRHVGPDMRQDSVITGTGPITLSGQVEATDFPLTGIHAGTALALSHYRNTHTYYF